MTTIQTNQMSLMTVIWQSPHFPQLGSMLYQIFPPLHVLDSMTHIHRNDCILELTISLVANSIYYTYYTYTKSFHSAVGPILDYTSEVWGYKNFTQIDAVQNKAIRIFLGAHKFVPIAAINRDMGWLC